MRASRAFSSRGQLQLQLRVYSLDSDTQTNEMDATRQKVYDYRLQTPRCDGRSTIRDARELPDVVKILISISKVHKIQLKYSRRDNAHTNS